MHPAKPKSRSALRLYAGTKYYTLKRYLLWYFGNIPFASNTAAPTGTEHAPLAYPVFSHQTPLLRQLKDVDMQLQYNKITNLNLAVAKINGIILPPGKVFSFWKTIGKPTMKKGYLEGMVLQNGMFKPGTGGGLCQLSNLIYWMTLHTELAVTERHRHSYDVFPDADRTQPFGSGATCFYNYGDLMIQNNTPKSFQLLLEVTDTDLKGQWRSDAPPFYTYKVYEKDHRIQSDIWNRYTRHNTLYRHKLGRNGQLLADEYVIENHAVMMYEPLLPDSNTRSQ